MKVALIFIVPS
jgi:hypothetical protein